MAKKIVKKRYDVTKHVLVPVHSLLSEKEKEALLERHGITLHQLPKIRKGDPAISHLDVKQGDVIKIARKSPTSGKSVFYRVVIE